MNIDQMIQCLQWAKEGRLQANFSGNGWKDAEGGLVRINEPFCIYRRRPEPKLRPWKPEEVPVGAIVRRHGSVAKMLIVGHGMGKVYYSQEGECCIDTLFVEFQHSTDGGKTWKPCGVEE